MSSLNMMYDVANTSRVTIISLKVTMLKFDKLYMSVLILCVINRLKLFKKLVVNLCSRKLITINGE